MTDVGERDITTNVFCTCGAEPADHLQRAVTVREDSDYASIVRFFVMP